MCPVLWDIILLSGTTRDTMVKPSIIAIDGPSASGKSSVGHLLAERLGYRFLDTGAMYRALAWLALQRHVGLDDEEALASLAAKTRIEVSAGSVANGRLYSVFVDGEDVTWHIREPAVDSTVSLVARHPKVRDAMVEKQRLMAKDGNIVVEGRDIGTVVFPRAVLKVYLTASAAERGRRRYRQLGERGRRVEYEAIVGDLGRRDDIDSQREASPLRPAADARTIHTDKLDVEGVVDEIMRLVEGS